MANASFPALRSLRTWGIDIRFSDEATCGKNNIGERIDRNGHHFSIAVNDCTACCVVCSLGGGVMHKGL